MLSIYFIINNTNKMIKYTEYLTDPAYMYIHRNINKITGRFGRLSKLFSFILLQNKVTQVARNDRQLVCNLATC